MHTSILMCIPIIYIITRIDPVPDIVEHVLLCSESYHRAEFIHSVHTGEEVFRLDSGISTTWENPYRDIRFGDRLGLFDRWITDNRKECSKLVRVGAREITGAEALFPLMEVWADEFSKNYPNLNIEVTNVGSEKGMEARYPLVKMFTLAWSVGDQMIMHNKAEYNYTPFDLEDVWFVFQ